MFLLLAPRVLRFGLEYIGVCEEQQHKMSAAVRDEVFCWHYGSASFVIAEIFFHIQQAGIPEKENSLRGFKRFMAAIFFLWVYPRSSGLLSTRFQMCQKYCQGQVLWTWIKRIESLKEKKIKWDDSLADPEKSAFVASIDGTDCKIWEPRANHRYNVDKTFFSKKFAHAGIKYEIVLDILNAKCMSIVGPVKASVHDLNVFRIETKQKMLAMPGKKLIADSIYKPKESDNPEEMEMFAIPRTTDDSALKRFKSRVRCRHEGFNARIKQFAFLRDGYRGVDLEKHGWAFKAICVIVQYQMDNGSPIFITN